MAARAEEIEMRTFNWAIWKVFAPLLFVLTLFPFYRYFLGAPHPFAQAFAQGDLVLFSAIMLFEVSGEIDGCRRQPRRLRVGSAVAKLLAVSLVAPYWMLKQAVVVRERQLADSKLAAKAQAEIFDTLRGYACFNCTVVLFGLIVAGILAVALLDYLKGEELREFGVNV